MFGRYLFCLVGGGEVTHTRCPHGAFDRQKQQTIAILDPFQQGIDDQRWFSFRSPVPERISTNRQRVWTQFRTLMQLHHWSMVG